jgi:hypothetical protein
MSGVRAQADIARTVVHCAPATSSRLACRRRPAQQLRQLGEVRRHATRLVLGQQVRRRTSSGLVLEVEVAERLSVLVAEDEARIVVLLDDPRRREAASGPDYVRRLSVDIPGKHPRVHRSVDCHKFLENRHVVKVISTKEEKRRLLLLRPPLPTDGLL